jgi:hypothetical protein
MNLDAQQLEQVRLSILRYGARLVSVGLLRSYLRSEGFRGITDEQVRDEVQYLEDKGLFTKDASKRVSPENALYRTTADGRDYLATQGQG